MNNTTFEKDFYLLKNINNNKNYNRNIKFKDLIFNQRYLFHQKNGVKFTANLISYNSANNTLRVYLLIN
jgi:hypothetical protein